MAASCLPDSTCNESAESQVDFDREITDGFAARYIRRKARQLVGRAGLTADDCPDLEQEMALLLFRRLSQFNPQRAHWYAFVVTVIERYAATILESRRTRKRRHTLPVASLSSSAAGSDGKKSELSALVEPRHCSARTGQYPRDTLGCVELQVDVATVIASLPAEDRWLCWRLQLETVAEMAEQVRISRQAIYSRLHRLRRIFAAAGCDEFLDRRVSTRLRSGR